MDTDHQEKKKLKSWLPCGCIVVAILLLMALPAIFLFAWNYDHGRKIKRQMAKIREAGQPTSFAELEEFYHVPEGSTDTTQLWLDGMQRLVDNEFRASAEKLPFVGEGKPVPPGEPWPELAEAEVLLGRYAEMLDKFHTAADLGGAARYPVDFSAGLETKLDHVQKLRTVVTLLCLEAYVRAHRGDASSCAQSIRAMLAARRSLEREPYLVTHLVCIALHSMAAESLADTISTVKFSEDDLRFFQREMRSYDSRVGLRRGLIGDRVIGCEGFQSGSYR